MIPQNTQLKTGNFVNTFPRTRPITDDISQTEDLIDLLFLDILQNFLQSNQVP